MKDEADFLRQVAEHQMTVLRDEGIYRHIRFAKPGTRCMSFDLLTWPGSLCYTGDMGTYVFARLEDMFQFFRTDREHHRPKEGRTLAINPGYWGEKLQAVDRHDGFREWSAELFEHAVRSDLAGFTEFWDDESRAELTDAVESEVLNATDQHEAIEAVRKFSHKGADDLFQEFWEHRLEDYTYRFMWCCYALAWGVSKYDELNGSAATTSPNETEPCTKGTTGGQDNGS